MHLQRCQLAKSVQNHSRTRKREKLTYSLRAQPPHRGRAARPSLRQAHQLARPQVLALAFRRRQKDQCVPSNYHSLAPGTDSWLETAYYRLQDVQSTSDRLNQLADDLARARRIQASAQPRTTRRRTPEQQAELDETLKSAAAAVVSAKQALDAFIEERRVLVEAARKVRRAFHSLLASFMDARAVG